tara:strand:+ start:521 stop:715 length:195 start_codon:yes stop_codon:yes gene_type:complete
MRLDKRKRDELNNISNIASSMGSNRFKQESELYKRARVFSNHKGSVAKYKPSDCIFDACMRSKG